MYKASVSQAHSVRRDLTSSNVRFIMQSLVLYGQATKRIRWMPWQLEAMKDVAICDKLGEVDNKRYIPRFPNGETHLP